jgi:HlyD family secretion protein
VQSIFGIVVHERREQMRAITTVVGVAACLVLASAGEVVAADPHNTPNNPNPTGRPELQGLGEQVLIKEQAIEMAEAETRMAEASVENARAVVAQKKAVLDQAQLDLDRTIIRSPIDGLVIHRDVNPGQTVAVSLEAKTLFKIAKDLRIMEVHGNVDEADVGHTKPGQIARFTVDAYPDRTFTGRVIQVRKFPQVAQNVVTYTTIISAPNPDLLLLPGMTAQLQIVTSDSGDVLKIPNQALRFRPDGLSLRAGSKSGEGESAERSATVWIPDDYGQPVPVRVQLGVEDSNSSELRGGPLTEGQPLIVGVGSSQTQNGFLGIRLGF